MANRKRKEKISTTTKAVAIAIPLLLFAIATILSISGNKPSHTNPGTTGTVTEKNSTNNPSTKSEPETQNAQAQETDANSKTVNLYFMDPVSNTLATEPVQIVIDPALTEAKRNEQLVKDVAARLMDGPKSTTLQPVVPSGVSIVEVHLLKDKKAEIYMSKEYADLPASSALQEIRLRMSLILTFTDLDFISSVKIFAGEDELLDDNGQPLGYETRETMLLNEPIDATDSAQERTFKLYFSNYDMTHLTVEERVVKINPNQDVERIVVEQVIKGPQQENLFAVIPAETRIIDIYTKDDVCYLDLSSDFITKHQSGSTMDFLAAYSIVNSLTELPGIKKVQFLFDGMKQEGFEHFDLTKPIERDLGV